MLSEARESAERVSLSAVDPFTLRSDYAPPGARYTFPPWPTCRFSPRVGAALCAAAPRGRLAARGGGDGRRIVRGQVPRGRTGPEGAGRGAAGGPPGLAARSAGAGAGAGAPPAAVRPQRARSRDPGRAPPQPRPQRRPSLPGRRVQLRLRGRARRGDARLRGAAGLARRAGHQSGPDAPEPQPSGLAAPPLADRPRRRALRPSRLAERDAGEGSEPVPPHRDATSSWPTATGSRRRTPLSPPRWTTQRSAPSSSRCPTSC